MVDALGGRGGLFERAEAALRRQLTANPNDAEALLRLGDLLRGEGRLDAALDAYRRVAELRPGHPKASWLCAVLGDANLPSAPQAPDAWPAPFVRVRSFLPPDEHAALLARMLAGREHFGEPARVGAGYVPDPRTRTTRRPMAGSPLRCGLASSRGCASSWTVRRQGWGCAAWAHAAWI